MLDLINFLFVLIVLVVLYKYCRIRIKQIYFLLLLLHIFPIFLLNGFLIDPNYMPDQLKYLQVAQSIRIGHFFSPENFEYGMPVYYTGLFFGLFPIPFINSIYSIAMINYLLYIFVFAFMCKKKFFNIKPIVYFYLLYPSMMLYSSLSLRDMLIFVLMFFSVYYLIVRNNKIFWLVLLVPLKFLKFQNLLIVVISFLGSMIFKRSSLKISVVTLLLFGIVYFVFQDYFSIEMLDHYRYKFYKENLDNIEGSPYVPINSLSDIMRYLLPDTFYFMLRPLPWKEFGVFQLMQFIENIVIIILISHIVIKNTKLHLWRFQEIKFLNLMLWISFIVYGLVIFNSGTAVRYKFPFIAVYIIFSYYFIYQDKINFKKRVYEQ